LIICRASLPLRLVDNHLREQEVDVDTGIFCSRDDRDLASQRMRAADAVDLPRIGRSHHR
jgi:hypothetical protein